MITPIQSVQAATRSESSPPDANERASAPAAVQAPKAPAQQPEADVRLTIDASPDGPFFVYTLKDRATGRIIVQLPQHRAEGLGEQPDYQPGGLVRAKA